MPFVNELNVFLVRTLATTTVTAYTGGGINIKCKYEDEHKTKTKSFCKMGTQHRCLSQINTEAHKEWIHKGRFSIQDTKQKGFFSVLIRELTVEDTGTYRCAVGSSDQTYTVVNLNIEGDGVLKYHLAEEPCCKPAFLSNLKENSTLLVNLYN